MNFIHLETAPEPTSFVIFWIIAALIGLAAIGLIVYALWRDATLLIMLVPAFFVGLGLLIVVDSLQDSANDDLRRDQLKAVHAQIEDHYGIDLEKGELAALHYPKSKPRGNFKGYGSFEQTVAAESGEGFVQRKIVLAWQNGKMVLGQSTNGENFAPLKAKS